MITRPQKAPSKPITDEQLELLSYPVLGSVKLDGYRCTTENGAFTSSMKPVTNRYIQNILSDPIYNGLDGELIVGPANDPNVFNNTTGPVRRAEGKPDFTFYLFDHLDRLQQPYKIRHALLHNVRSLPHIMVLTQRHLRSPKDVIAFDQWCVDQGFEGAMIRSTDGKYKQGRCTLRELNIFKRKPVADDECEIIGFEEQLENNNETYINELGLTVRSSHKENKTGKGTLGALVVKSKLWDEPFRIGTGVGLNDKLRKYMWENQSDFLGTIWVYKYQKYGSINAPRQPILKGCRDGKDITNY
jgi:DNA ligase-1